MLLKDILKDAPKADLQSFYLFWCPDQTMTSSRDKLVQELADVMGEPERVRARFDGLTRSQKAFLISLLARDDLSGTVDQVRSERHGRQIEDFEVEVILKTLLGSGYVFQTPVHDPGDPETYLIAKEVATALRRTVAIENREPMEMLSLQRAAASGVLRNGTRGGNSKNGSGKKSRASAASGLGQKLAAIDDRELRSLVEESLSTHNGILCHTDISGNGSGEVVLHRDDWRRLLERVGVGTTGILNLKVYGIRLESEALIVFQEHVYADALERSCRGPIENDVEVYVGTDFIIDIDRMLELLRTEQLEVTREGKLFKKTEERIAGAFVTSSHNDHFEGSAVSHILDVCRRLRFIDNEGQKIVGDPLRRIAWQKKSLEAKLKALYELYYSEQQGQRWSFHQRALRDLLIDHLKEYSPRQVSSNGWLATQPFFDAVVSRYLLSLDEQNVREEFQQRCNDDFRNERLMVRFAKLHHDLSYWTVNRLALLGLLDVGFKDGLFHSLRLSDLGLKYFGLGAGAEAIEQRPALVNPDFEVMVFPGSDDEDEANLELSRFADRMDSDRVRRYRLTRDSLKRGIVSGLSTEQIMRVLERFSRAALPPNVVFSLREWTEGVEFVRRQKVLLLRAATGEGGHRLEKLLQENDVPCERLNDTTVMVRGTKNERAVHNLHETFRKLGLFVE